MTAPARPSPRRPPALVDGNDVLGAHRLLVDAITGTTDLVEAVHASILAWPRRIVGLPPKPVTGGIPGLAYDGVRGVTRLAGNGIERILRWLPAAAPGEVDRVPHREAAVAALNGVFGDHLAATGNPLAIEARLRIAGRALVLQPAALAERMDRPRSRLLVMVHGLCMNDLQWQQGGHHHGDTLADALGFEVIHLHYNSGLPIAANGREFSALLQRLAESWPVPIERIAIVAHSMGGLVARAAIAAAQGSASPWLDRLDTLATLGTPHSGAPLERAGHLLQTLLGASAHSAPFRVVGGLRSAGIQDLRHGGPRARHPPFPAHVRAFAVAASTQARADGACRDLRGDGLVPVASAFGDHDDPGMALGIPRRNRLLVHSTGHIGLLSNRKVQARLRDWLA